jgi:hypothetical protein
MKHLLVLENFGWENYKTNVYLYGLHYMLHYCRDNVVECSTTAPYKKENILQYVGLEVFTEVVMKIAIFRNIVSCSP